MLLAGHQPPQEIVTGYSERLIDRGQKDTARTQRQRLNIRTEISVYVRGASSSHVLESVPCAYANEPTCLPQGEVVLAVYG